MVNKKIYSKENGSQIPLRIEEFRQHQGLSKTQLCDRIGFPLGTYSHMAGRRRSKPSAELLAALAEHTEANPQWLLTGHGPMLREGAREAEPGLYSEREIEGRFVLVPFYDVRASAGGGALVEQERVLGRLAFRAEWVYRELKVAPESLALIGATGDSMHPTIAHGDLLLLNVHQTQVSDDAIYALEVQGVLLIKRVQLLVDGTLVIRSDNPLYGEQRVRLDDPAPPRIVGRVVWIARRV
ncbi:MAG TPA: helix-turn-helix transcriptional regulator [bacterium]|nr:helix-turn-helix transcriptional regulator [bacterium]